VNPIFIVGLPRSGTALLERILGAHPHVQGLGQQSLLQDAIAPMCQQQSGQWMEPKHIDGDFWAHAFSETQDKLESMVQHENAIDRWLSNQSAQSASKRRVHFVATAHPEDFVNVGAMHLLYPESPIIHITRNARDSAVSIHWRDFGDLNKLPWTLSLNDTADYIEEYSQLMVHWSRLLPFLRKGAKDTVQSPFVAVSFEDLVLNPQVTVRSLLQTLGLDSDDSSVTACLDFWRHSQHATGISSFHGERKSVPVHARHSLRHKYHRYLGSDELHALERVKRGERSAPSGHLGGEDSALSGRRASGTSTVAISTAIWTAMSSVLLKGLNLEA